ncbi:3-oxoacyl-ACP synthase [Candidatus Saganbacteria bacterium]|nr:3-oxoacyl-ACP synthase [Candidatus Saganbacteria bacterium]
MARIIAIGLANPKRCLTQEESWDNLQRLRSLSPLEKKYYKKFMLDDGIAVRHLALPALEDIFCEDQDLIIKRYSEEAPKIAQASTLQAINLAGLKKEEIDFLVTASCSGYLCPGLSSYMIELAALRPDVSSLDLQGMGCGAALPALSAADNFLAKKPAPAFALANCTEICSAAVYWDDDLGLILSNSIFADGAASAVLTNTAGMAGPEIIDYETVSFPDRREDLRFTVSQGKLRNKLTAAVPVIAAKGAGIVVGKLLERGNLQKKEISFWALHTGGRKVLSMIAENLGLTAADIKPSAETLKKYGNMSSPSVLFALENIINSKLPQVGDYGIILSFGAGFSCYGMLLRW